MFNFLKKSKKEEIESKKAEDYKISKEVEELAESLNGGYWNYRILQLEYKDKFGKDRWYEMREVYYDSEDKIWAWSENPECFSVESIEDVKELKEKVALAMSKPILAVRKDKNGKDHIRELKKTIYDIRRKGNG